MQSCHSRRPNRCFGFAASPYSRMPYDHYVQRGREDARKLADVVFDALGATQRMHVDGFFGAGHIMGTYRMGTDATSSVVDPVGRAHDHSNLFLIGSGAFPTGGTANPTLTLAALALMTAAEVAKSLSARRRAAESAAPPVRLSRLSQRHRVGARWKSELPSRIVRGTPHRLGHIGLGRHRGRLGKRSEDGLRERRVRLRNQPIHA